MIDEDQFIQNLESTISDITDRLTRHPGMQPMVRLLESTRARVLMDIIEAIRPIEIVQTDAPETKPADI